MKLCLIAPDLRTLGGYELQLTALVTGLAEAGHAVHLFVRDGVDPQHPYWRAICGSGVVAHTTPRWLRAITPIRFGEKRWATRLVDCLMPLWNVLALPLASVQRRSRARTVQAIAGVVHGWLNQLAHIDPQQWWMNRQLDWLWLQAAPDLVDIQHSMIPAGFRYARRRGVPLIYTEYGAPNRELLSVWLPMRDLVNQADLVMGRADASISGLRELCNLRDDMPTVIVPNAVTTAPTDDRATALPTAETVTMMAIGRISAEKAPLTLLSAFKTAHTQHPHARLIYAGDGPLRPQLEQQVAALDLQGAVQITGRFDSLPPLIQQADFVVHPTLNDGRSVAVLEAMAWGRAVVGTRVGGVAELVEDGVTGRLVAPNDAAQLADGLCQLVADRALREQMGQAARAHFLQGAFSAEAMVAKTLETYQRVLLQQPQPKLRRVEPSTFHASF